MTDQPTALQRAQGELVAAAVRTDSFTRAAQIAVVAQAEAAHRQADALERIANALEQVDHKLDSVTLASGLAVVLRP